MRYRVFLTKKATKGIEKVPQHVAVKLFAWVEQVESDGLREARLVKGFHDEPLQGKRKGQRSIRLSRGYRVVYSELRGGEVGFVKIEEVHHHEY